MNKLRKSKSELIKEAQTVYAQERVEKGKRKGIIKRLGKYVIAEWYLFLPAIILTLISNQLSLMGPRFSGAAIDALSGAGGVDLPTVYENVIRMILCYVFSALLSYGLAVLMVHVSQRIVVKMRRQLFE